MKLSDLANLQCFDCKSDNLILIFSAETNSVAYKCRCCGFTKTLVPLPTTLIGEKKKNIVREEFNL
jgi:hypothetical protein